MSIKIALAQTKPDVGNITFNLYQHLKLVHLASSKNVDLIVFPELSLTGYTRALKPEMIFSEEDQRIVPLKEASVTHSIIIVVGIPLQSATGVHIASLFLYPDSRQEVYTKRFLHEGEEISFTVGSSNPLIKIGNEIIANAICADFNHSEHAEMAKKSGATIYLASAFITKKGYDADAEILRNYAMKHKMKVMLSNYADWPGDFTSAGKSAAWLPDGTLVAQLNQTGPGVLFLENTTEGWAGNIYYL